MPYSSPPTVHLVENHDDPFLSCRDWARLVPHHSVQHAEVPGTHVVLKLGFRLAVPYLQRATDTGLLLGGVWKAKDHRAVNVAPVDVLPQLVVAPYGLVPRDERVQALAAPAQEAAHTLEPRDKSGVA